MLKIDNECRLSGSLLLTLQSFRCFCHQRITADFQLLLLWKGGIVNFCSDPCFMRATKGSAGGQVSLAAMPTNQIHEGRGEVPGRSRTRSALSSIISMMTNEGALLR